MRYVMCQIQNSVSFWKYPEKPRLASFLCFLVFPSRPINISNTEGAFTAMIVPIMGKDPRWLQVEVCREFQRGKCKRREDECRYAHPPVHVLVQNGKVTACFDSLKGRCHREKCKYLHPPKHIKTLMENNGRLQQQQQQQLALQQQALGPLAQQMLTNPTSLVQWPLGVPTTSSSYLQQPITFVPDAIALSASRRADKSDKLEVCREYQRGACSREELECRYAHPPPHVSIDNADGMVTVCMDFMKAKCQRDMCRYFHPPGHLQGKVRAAQQSTVGGVQLESSSRKRTYDAIAEPLGEPFAKQPAFELPLLAQLQPYQQSSLGAMQFTPTVIPTVPTVSMLTGLAGLPLLQAQVPPQQVQQPQTYYYVPMERDTLPSQPHVQPYEMVAPQGQGLGVTYWNGYTYPSLPNAPTSPTMLSHT